LRFEICGNFFEGEGLGNIAASLERLKEAFFPPKKKIWTCKKGHPLKKISRARE